MAKGSARRATMPTPDLGCSRRILRTVEDDPKPLTNFADNSEPWACIRWAHNSSSKQNRQAECDSPDGFAWGTSGLWGAMSGEVVIAHLTDAATKPAA